MKPDFNKDPSGLLPVIIQDVTTLQVLMLGYMNEEAFTLSQKRNRVTFYSRSKQRLWLKGESSGHFLNIVDWQLDCDSDTILVLANPAGPTCHRGINSCFDEFPDQDTDHAVASQRRVVTADGIIKNIPSDQSDQKMEVLPEQKSKPEKPFSIYSLEQTIHERIDSKAEGSYTYSLIKKGINKVAQKVGEEAIETVIDAVNGTDKDFLYESADLMYHYLVLLKAKGFSLKDIEKELAKRK